MRLEEVFGVIGDFAKRDDVRLTVRIGVMRDCGLKGRVA